MTAQHPPAATGQVLSEKLDELGQKVDRLIHQIKQMRIEQQAVLSRVQPLPNPAAQEQAAER
jgi:outer membrane murein-binding lipoprotein Lpp